MKSNLLFFIFLLFFSGVTGQDIVFPADTIIESGGQDFMPCLPGTTEKTLKIAPAVARMKPSQVSQLKKKLEKCSDLFLTNPVFNPLTGLKIRVNEEIFPLEGINEPVKWIPSSVEVGLCTTLAKDSLPYWESEADARVTVYFNNPGKLVGNPVIGNIYVEPVLTGISGPWEEFDRISMSDRITATRRNDLPWFEPVSREEFLLTLITYFQGSIEKAEKKAVRPKPAGSHNNVSTRDSERQKYASELEKIRKIDPVLAEKLMQAYLAAEGPGETDDQFPKPGSQVDYNIMLNTWREAVRKLRAEMNAMSPVELKSQAWWSDTEDSNVSGLTPSGFTGSRPLVRLNKNLIDKTRPISSIQIIVAEWSVLPGSDFTETYGYDLSYGKIAQLWKDRGLWQQIFELIDF